MVYLWITFAVAFEGRLFYGFYVDFDLIESFLFRLA